MAKVQNIFYQCNRSCNFLIYHDYHLLDSVANRIVEITPKGLIDQTMSYGEYLHSDKVRKMRAEMYG